MRVSSSVRVATFAAATVVLAGWPVYVNHVASPSAPPVAGPTPARSAAFSAPVIPVAGSPLRGQAPRIGHGRYVDTIDDRETTHYRIDVPRAVAVRVWVTESLPDSGAGPGDAAWLRATLTDERGRSCTTGLAATVNGEQRSITASFSWHYGLEQRCTPVGKEARTIPRYLEVERRPNVGRPDSSRHRLVVVVDIQNDART